MPKVWNKRDPNCPKDAVYIGRPSKWGNPFELKREKDRPAIVDAYRDHLLHESTNPASVYYQMRLVQEELKGKDLVCWCAPKACHGDILLEIANYDEYECDCLDVHWSLNLTDYSCGCECHKNA